MTDRDRALRFSEQAGYMGAAPWLEFLVVEFAAVRAAEREKYVAALRLAVEALDDTLGYVKSDYETRRHDYGGAQGTVDKAEAALAACRKVVGE